ncbi:alpha-ketoglutarate-dependent sulfonate dioxygenase [Lactarius deliciosus]|nr:alpha-ketoglutarate-dependent sulfonate dioxygenase [Lactarius deliciosus]
MAPVATERQQLINPFYSPSTTDDGDKQYKYAQYKPTFPAVSWEPLKEFNVVDRGLGADPEKKSLLSAASKVITLTPAIGTELHGIDLRQLSDVQKDELSLLVAERGVVFFRNQDLNIHEQLDLGRHWGPLHKHATTPVPKEPGLEEVHVVYTDSSRRPDPASFTKIDLWHSDVSYELQPPSATSLKVITGPETGGDTLWSSRLCPLLTYLEGLYAVHSAGKPVRREPIETTHPVVRVHPATGWKSVYVNPGFTRRIVGVPKAESDVILAFLFAQIAENHDFHARFKWDTNDVAIWDNRVVTHTATFDFWPATRHCPSCHAARRTPDLGRGLRAHDREACARPPAGLVGASRHPAARTRTEGFTEISWIQ